jgi:large subunit ribosomal protein L37Ae
MAKKKKRDIGLRTMGGATLRKRYARVMKTVKATNKCPSCASPSVKRVSVGLWTCKKCGYRFAGGAYTPSTKLGEAAARVRTQG